MIENILSLAYTDAYVRDYRAGYPRQFSRFLHSSPVLAGMVGGYPLRAAMCRKRDRGESATINRAIYEAARATTTLLQE